MLLRGGSFFNESIICRNVIILLQGGPASPVKKIAKKVPVKKPVPVMSESEEVVFQILHCFQQRLYKNC